MASETRTLDRLDAKRREQTPQALARLVVIGLFIGLWLLLWLLRIPMPFPFLIVLLTEALFFLAYWRVVFLLPRAGAVERAQYGMLAAEIVFHTTMVYFLGGISWLGAFAYVFGLIFANTFLDLRRGLIYASGVSLAIAALILLEATGAIPHYVYLEQGPLRYTDPRFVATTIIAGFGVFFTISLWVNWIGHLLRQERDAAIHARAELQRANEELEERVKKRTAELELANAALRESEERLRTVVTNAPVVLFAIDREGVFTLSEGKGLEALGLKPGQVVGQSVFDVYRDVPEIIENIHRALAGEAFTTTVEVAGREFETHYAPLRDRDGRMLGGIGVATDTTERRQAEEALRFTQFATDRAAFAVFWLDSDGRLLYVNDAACYSLGYSRKELLSLTVHDIDPDFPPDVWPGHWNDIRQRGSVTLESHHRTKDGRVFPVEITANYLEFDGKGYHCAFARDITERKRAEEALRESEAKYRRIFENVQDIFYQTDLEGTIVELSPSVERYGYTREQLIGTSVLNVYEDPDERAAFVEALLKHGEIVDYELRLKTGDGRVVDASVSAHICRGPDGAPFTIEGALRDISERKRAEEALRESESKFRAMAETVAAATFIFQGTRMRYVNSSAQAITGYTRQELLAMNFWDVIHPDLQDLVRERGLARQRGEQVPVRYEVKLLTKDGEERWVDFTAGMIEFAGQLAVLGTAFDITERKRAEEALREQVRRDPLTGALNHAAIVQELRALIAESNGTVSHAVAMVDVDGLKEVNDTYGHQIGDTVLLVVAEALSQNDALVGRYGGDEFVAILRESDRPAAERYRKAVLDSLARAGLTDPETGTHVPVVASIGLAIYPEEAETIDDLIRLSDSAMYASRRQRPVGSGGLTTAAPLGGDRAAEMVGQIVPLLTSPAKLEEKIRLVAQRISIGAGYDAVNIDIFSQRGHSPSTRNVFARVPKKVIEAWRAEERRIEDDPFVQLLLRTRRGIIVEDPQNDERLTETQRRVLRVAQLRSAAVVPLLWDEEMIGTLSVASKRAGAFTPSDVQFLATVATQISAIVRMATLVDELQSSSTRLLQAQEETVMLLAAAAEAHDQSTGRHLQGVRALAEALARELGYDEEDARELGLAAVLHDIGKIRVPDTVLARSGQLSEEDWELLKRHTTWGAQFLAGRPGFELAATIALSHHERWDGSGYPDGLSGDAIPEAATIVAVADSFDAITNDRPYRSRRSVERAVWEIAACSGEQFSPKVVEALQRLRKRKTLPFPPTKAPGEAA